MWYLLIILLSLPTLLYANDVNGDLNTNIQDSTMDSNNSTESTTNNYNATGAGSPAPVMSAVAPTMMGGGGNDSCLIPKSQGIQLSIVGISKGDMEQDPECNRRKDARLLGTPQTVGGLGLQVSAISVMCASPEVFKAMALSNTPCPIIDIDSGRLLLGREAFEAYRKHPTTYIVGYSNAKPFWDNLLKVGRKLKDVETQPNNRKSLSEQFRTSRSGTRQLDQQIGRD